MGGAEPSLRPSSTPEGLVIVAERRPRPWMNVQDGHTLGENAVYTALHRLAYQDRNPRPGYITIGTGTLAPYTGIAESNVRIALRGLAAKLAIDELGRRGQKGQEYRVYKFEDIIARRRAAGLTHVLKVTRKVTLCDADGNTAGPNSAGPVLKLTGPNSGGPEQKTGGPNLGNLGGPNLSPHLKEVFLEGSITSTWKEAVRSGVARVFEGRFDDDACQQVADGCLANVPEITNAELQEVAERVARIAAWLYRAEKLKGTWTGFIIKRAPVLASELVREIRETARREQDIIAELAVGSQMPD